MKTFASQTKTLPAANFLHSAIITFTCNHNQEASFSLLNSDLCPTGGFPNLITKRRFEAPKIGRKLINNEN